MPRCLILNSTYEVLGVIPEHKRWRPVQLVLSGRAQLLASYDEPLRGCNIAMPRPAVIIRQGYVQARRHRDRPVAPRKRNVLIRDGFQCAYCGRRLSMTSGTIDHVVPRARGGPDAMTNVVACCWDCNQRKADRTPEDAGMRLLQRPRGFGPNDRLQTIWRTVRSEEKSVWLDCLRRLSVPLHVA